MEIAGDHISVVPAPVEPFANQTPSSNQIPTSHLSGQTGQNPSEQQQTSEARAVTRYMLISPRISQRKKTTTVALPNISCTEQFPFPSKKEPRLAAT